MHGETLKVAEHLLDSPTYSLAKIHRTPTGPANDNITL